MTDRAKRVMELIWEERNSHVDTEEKLVSTILKIIPDFVVKYNAQNDIVVLDLNDLISLSEELKEVE